jgi:hypothetical protein
MNELDVLQCIHDENPPEDWEIELSKIEKKFVRNCI